MKTLTLLLAGIPEPREITVSPDLADIALTGFRAQVVTALPLDDGSVLHLNMRQVAGIAVEDADGEPAPAAPAPTDAPAEQPSTKMIPDPDPHHDPDRTVDELKAALDAASIDYPSNARKAELQELARTHDV